VKYALACLVALAVLFAASASSAAEPVVGIHVEGPDRAAGLDAIGKAFPEGLAVADPASVDEVLERAGVGKSLGARLATDKSRKALAAKLGKEMRPGQLDALVVAGTVKTGKSRRVVVLLVGSASGDPLASGSYDLKKTGALAGALGPALTALAKPAEPAPPTADESAAMTATLTAARAESDQAWPPPSAAPTVVPDRAESADRHDERSPFDAGWIVAELHAGAAGRDFGYKGQVTRSPRSYSLTAAPRAGLSVEVYPLAQTPLVVARDLGLVGGYDRSFAISSKLGGQPSLDSTWYSYKLGLRGRQRVGSRAVVGLEGAYVRDSFTFSGDDPVAVSRSPSVDYAAVRFALDGRVDVGRLGFVAGAGYRHVTDVGGVAQSFPRAHAAGVDAELGMSVRVATGLEARLRFAYTRYFFDLAPEVGDANVAGGALDQMFGVNAGLAFAR
jgi:hypothetical protein